MALLLLGSSDPAPTLRTSPHQALLFAVNNYQFMDELNYPIPNARAIAAELENHYGFQAEVVENPTFDEVDQALKRYRQAYAESDFAPEGQLLIFFSGHGIQEGANGYFMASDSDPQYPQRTALEYDYYRDLIDQINCDHILVAIDACHSATFDPHYGIRNNREFSRPGEANFDHVLANHDTYLTRCFWSSDLVGQPTPDKSDFADQLLAGLQAPTPAIGYRRSSELFAVHLELARPSPGGGRFGKDDPNGCFLFFQKTEDYIDDARSDLAAWQAAQQAGTADAYRQYIRENRRGDFIPLAEAELARLEATGHELAAWDAAKQANTPSAYQVFLATYPDSPYRDLAMHKWEASLKVALPDMVTVAGGSFQMGSNEGWEDEKPVHPVVLSAYQVGRYEVTNEAFVAFLNSSPARVQNDSIWIDSHLIYDLACRGYDDWFYPITYSGGRFSVENRYAQHPVVVVTWYGAVHYCNWLSQQHGYAPVYSIDNSAVRANWEANGYRLPTEAEWEYAARSRTANDEWAGTSSKSDLPLYANYDSDLLDGFAVTAPVGTFKPNGLGLFDMSGNADEWCWDWLSEGYYHQSPRQNPRGPESGTERIFRGGSYEYDERHCRITTRDWDLPLVLDDFYGIRLARNVE